MPPARPRIIADDARSETASTTTNLKDRTNGIGGISKGKKLNSSTLNNSISSTKVPIVDGTVAAAIDTTKGPADLEVELPHIDWNTIPVSSLHAYRGAYKLQTPSAYTQPHSDLIYNSSEVAHRSPSAVLARRKLRDLKSHRRKLAQIDGINTMNGPNKKSKQRSKNNISSKMDSRDGRRRYDSNQNGHSLDNSETAIAQSIEPLSPATRSATQSADDPSPSNHSSLIEPPSTLNRADPEATIIGRQTPLSLATTIRKHFNAQQLNEAETISRFTYVIRQQGSGVQHRISKTYPQSQRLNLSNLTVSAGAGQPLNSSGASLSSSNKPYTLGGNHVQVEGGAGDGQGWIMGSMGRQVRLSDSGGGGTFRLRFRP